MKRYLLFLMAIALILCLQDAVSAEIEIKAQVDKNKLTTDELLTYKLIITSTGKNIPAPKVPKFEGFNIISQADSSTISFVKSGIKNIIVHVFILAPKESGEFKIEPSQIKFKGKTCQSEAFNIQVMPGKTKPIMPPKTKPNLPEEQPEEPAPQITL